MYQPINFNKYNLTKKMFESLLRGIFFGIITVYFYILSKEVCRNMRIKEFFKGAYKFILVGVPFMCIIFGCLIYFVRANGIKIGAGSDKKRGILENCKEMQIPDLSYTDVLGDACTCMTPQGICIAGEYILITAYCNVDSLKEELEKNSEQTVNQMRMEAEANHTRHNSVLYVLDRHNGSHVSTLVFDDKSHVGGITFDGDYVWVAKGGNCKIEGYSYVDLRACIDMGSYNYPMCKPLCEVVCEDITSFVTCYDDFIWVGTFSREESQNGVLIGYQVEEAGGIHCIETHKVIEIPPYANGAAFIDTDLGPYLAVTTSYGRNNNSTLHIYDATNLDKINANSREMLPEFSNYSLPPMAEELCVEDEDIYFLFESASTAYSFIEDSMCDDVTSTICILDRRNIINFD